MTTNELKPCPFCGGKAKVYDYEGKRDIYDPDTLGYVDTEYFTRWGCCCDACGAMVPDKRSEAEAIEAWNTRAERTCKMTKKGPEYVLGGWFECSECGVVYPPCNEEIALWALQYCPHCGARLVEE